MKKLIKAILDEFNFAKQERKDRYDAQRPERVPLNMEHQVLNNPDFKEAVSERVKTLQELRKNEQLPRGLTDEEKEWETRHRELDLRDDAIESTYETWAAKGKIKDILEGKNKGGNRER